MAHRGDRPLWLGLSRNVIVLGLVSLLTDLAAEMMVPLVPIFLTRELGGQPGVLGVISGVSESLSSLLKLWSGWLSDRIGKRKALIVLGYGIASLLRPLMGFATSWWHVLGVRLVDRVGKGIRIAPRDALLADSCEPAARGRAFGFQQMADNLGAAIGPLLSLLLLSLGAPFRTIFFAAIVPGAVLLVFAGVGIVEKPPQKSAAPPRLALAPFDARFRLYLVATLLFHLAVISEFFLILRMDAERFSVGEILLTWSAFSALRSVCAMLGGALSDRFSRRALILSGWSLFAAAWGAMAWVQDAWVLAPIAAYAVFGGLSQGPQRAFVADLVPDHLRGTAYGVYNFTLGIATLLANLGFGWTWQYVGMKPAFLAGGAWAVLGIAVLVAVGRPKRS